MGFDCTLHAVDEKQIADSFVRILLASGPPAGETPEHCGIEASMWEATRNSLADDSPEIAASTVCQLALVFASKKLPYHYERGFALSLWEKQPSDVRTRFPNELTDSPERLFRQLVKRYPALRGHFPTEFSGNWTTGKFIPASKVGKALSWVEKKVGAFEEGKRDLFRGLILALRYCRKGKLAYWEGTDLPIPMASMPVEGHESRAETSFKWPDYGYEPLAQAGSIFVCKYRLGPSPDARTAIADFSSWPPSLGWLDEYAVEAAFSRSGHMMTLASKPGETHHRIRVRENPAAPPRVLETSGVRVGEHGFEWVDFFEEEVVGLVSFKKG